MSDPPMRFAFRYWLVEPESSGRWQESATNAVPKPPLKWKVLGKKSYWYEWRAGRHVPVSRLRIDPKIPWNAQIQEINTTSIAWCAEFTTYWISPYDCSHSNLFAERERNPRRDWSLLCFWNLKHHPEWSRPGLHQTLAHGNKATLNFECPPGFNDFLPRNKFRSEPPRNYEPCHLFGNISTILALYAMCPENTDDILEHINQFFFRGGQSYFVPSTGTPRWNPRDHNETPERALVMQIGLIVHDAPTETIDLQKEMLQEWETGQRGPMVSSAPPTQAERQSWM